MRTRTPPAIALAVALLLVRAQGARAQASTDSSLVFDKIEAMVAMRDGVRLHTDVYVPKGASSPLPILLNRTPYGASQDAQGFAKALSTSYAALARDGYIFAFQDIRGRAKSEGQFVMLRPVRDKGDPKAVDESTDTHDTVEWLLRATKNNGPLEIYKTLEKKDARGQSVLAVGPWNHGGWSRGEGDSLGRIAFGSPTARHYREQIEAPFFACHLKDRCPKALPEVSSFQTGSNEWRQYDSWPPQSASARTLYLREKGELSFSPPPEGGEAADRYVSDPSNPVPYRPRPIEQTYPDTGPRGWPTWLVQDQRFVAGRPDVLVYETAPLTEDLTVTGNLEARLFAATTGGDADWIVKLIDVYPEVWPEDVSLAGYQLMVANDVFRARFRQSFETPLPLVPGKVEEYAIPLHALDHRFRKGHRIMVQVQSTWFPIIDRNPQTFVPNIFEAKDADYRAATHEIHRSRRFPSRIELPVVAP